MAELGVLTEAMPEQLQLMVTFASWCALRFGETSSCAAATSTGRRGDPHPARRRAHKGAYRSPHPRATPGSATSRSRRHHPRHRAHLAKHVDRGRDSLIFPADGGHLQPSTLYRHWYKGRDAAADRICGSTTSATPAPCWPPPPAPSGRTDGAAGAFDTAAAIRYQHVARAVAAKSRRC